MSRRSSCAQRQSWSAAHTLAARAALDDERTVTILPYSRDVEGCDVLWNWSVGSGPSGRSKLSMRKRLMYVSEAVLCFFRARVWFRENALK